MRKRYTYMVPFLCLVPFALSGCGIADNITSQVQEAVQEAVQKQLSEQAKQLLEENFIESPEPQLFEEFSSYTVPDSFYSINYVQTINDYVVRGEGYLGWENNECSANLVFTVSGSNPNSLNPDMEALVETEDQETFTVRFLKEFSSPAYLSKNNEATWFDSRGSDAPHLTLYTPTTLGLNGNINEQGLCSVPLWQDLFSLDDSNSGTYILNEYKFQEYTSSRVDGWIQGLLNEINLTLDGSISSQDSLDSLLFDSLSAEGMQIPNNLIDTQVFNEMLIIQNDKETTYTFGGSVPDSNTMVSLTLTPAKKQEVVLPDPSMLVNSYTLSNIPGFENFNEFKELLGLEELFGVSDLNNLENFDVESLLKLLE
jgi:hypothetical protein